MYKSFQNRVKLFEDYTRVYPEKIGIARRRRLMISNLISTLALAIACLAFFYENKHNKQSEENENKQIEHEHAAQIRSIIELCSNLILRIGSSETTQHKNNLRYGKENKELSDEDYEETKSYLFSLVHSANLALYFIEENNTLFNDFDMSLSEGEDKKDDRVVSPISYIVDFVKNTFELFELKVLEDQNLRNKETFEEMDVATSKYRNIIDVDQLIEECKLSLDNKEKIIMVALNKNLSNKNWSDQSLGDWIISQSKMKSIKYIVGIDVKTRQLVSLVKVKEPRIVNNSTRVRFEMDGEPIIEERKDDDDDSIRQLEEALLWNPQNPIKYLK